MSISPEDHVPEPEDKKNKMPTWALILIIAAVVLFVIVCCLVIVLIFVPIIFSSSQDWMPSFLIISSVAAEKPKLEILPLSIGGKSDPVRLIFNSNTGPAVAASMVDMGKRFRLIISEVNVVPTDSPLPKLPVARAFWTPKPDLKTAAAAWILAGGAHHTSFSFDVSSEHLQDFAEMAQIEVLHINEDTQINKLKQELRFNDLYYHLAKGL